MSTKFAFSGRNWPLFFIWLIFLDLRLSIHLPTLVQPASRQVHQVFFCCVFAPLAGWAVGICLFLCLGVVGSMFGPLGSMNPQKTPNHIQSLEK